MIKAKNGKIEIKGRGLDILADFCGIVESLKETGIPENVIDECFRLGKIGGEELGKRLSETIRKNLFGNDDKEESDAL